MDIIIESVSSIPMEVKKEEKVLKDNMLESTYQFRWDNKEVAQCEKPEIILKWSIPILDMHYMWHPMSQTKHNLEPDWGMKVSTMLSVSAPVLCFFNESEHNRYTCAVSEVKKVVNMNFGVHEEDGTLLCQVSIPLEQFGTIQEYEMKLLHAWEDIPFYKVIHKMADWMEQSNGITPLEPPTIAKLPMYSTWYDFHQNVNADEIEAECAIAAKLGCKTIILDDGWQTEDANRGYAYCGDWEVSELKMGNMHEHVKRIHDLDMKYIVWYSVSFIGKNSKNWNMFEDKLLFYIEQLNAGVVDPRYRQVREYLSNVYIDAVKNWDIDGLKLDFIDMFYLGQEKPITKEMDYICVQEAVDALLTDIVARLKKIKPDIMIEFRQRYIGPNMAKYGNIFRVTDCPNSALSNRIGMVDLRLLSRKTAVHSDMLMWNKEDLVESAALQILNVLFSTVQMSVKLRGISSEKFEMIAFWLSFMEKHQNVLLDGEFIPYQPQYLFPAIEARNEKERIYAVYGENRSVDLYSGTFVDVYIVNAKMTENIIIDIHENIGNCKCNYYNCMGKLERDEDKYFETGLQKIAIPKSGLLHIQILCN